MNITVYFTIFIKSGAFLMLNDKEDHQGPILYCVLKMLHSIILVSALSFYL